MIVEASHPPYLKELNPEQRNAVLHTGSPLLILAGAGSGKTRVITEKLAHLILNQGVNPRSILAVTFTNKAAQEMKERAVRICPQAEEVLIRTFHSFGAWFLRRNAALAGLDPGFSIYDEEDSLSILQSLYPRWEKKNLSRLAFAIGRAKDYGLHPEDPLYRISLNPDFPEVYRRYEERLYQIGNLDFGDLILRSLEILRRNPEVKQRTQDRFRVVLVDEYQDSNVAQHLLVKEMYSPGTYICVVGDDDQSIYRFRGAEVGNLLTFAEDFPNTQIIRLEQNYRSTAKILNAATAVVKNNRGRLGKTLWTGQGEGEEPLLIACTDQDEEARVCVELIRKNPTLETAILYRINAQSRVFETLLLREGIPYRVVGMVRFYEREEVRDALAFLRFLVNPRDEVSFRRIVNKPSRGIGEATVEAILSHWRGRENNLLDAIRIESEKRRGKAAANLKGFLDLYNRFLKAMEKKSLEKFIEFLIRESGLEEYHRLQDESGGSHKLRNLEELVNAASSYLPGIDGITQFLEEIELDAARISSTLESEEALVTLITLHNTKGLEFDRVIITGMEEELFPKVREGQTEDLEEERRLFYVGITRAKKELFFTFCSTRRLHGKILSMGHSRFLAELPKEVWAQSKPYLDRMLKDPNEPKGYAPGALVYHDEYGQGVVTRQGVKDGVLEIHVRFDSGKLAHFIPKYNTGLEKVSRDG